MAERPSSARIDRATLPVRIAAAALAVAIIVLAAQMVGIARYDTAILRYPFQVDDAEGVVLAEARLIGAGTDPYAFQPSPSAHFYAGPYPPFYTLLNTAGMALTGPTFKFGRAVQLLMTLAVGGWIAWAVARRAHARWMWLVGAWAAGLFLTAHLVAIWSVRVRPDMTALAANLAGVAILQRWSESAEQESLRESSWPRREEWPLLIGGAACFALGWWTKQTFIAVPVAFFIALFPRRPRIAISLAGLYGAMILVPFALLTGATGGGFFQKTVTYQGSWTWAAFRRLAQPFAERYAWLLLLAVIAAVAITMHARRLTFAVAWFTLAVLTAFGAGTSGGNHNHFIELLAVSAFVVGQAVALALDAARGPASRARWGIAACVAVVALLTGGIAGAEREGRYGWLAREYRAPSAADVAGFQSIASFIANHNGPVYSTDVGLLVVTGQTVRVTDPFTMAAEVRLHRWDDRDLVADLAAGRYGLVVTSYDVMAQNADLPPTDATTGIIRALQSRYHLAEKNVRYLYVPNEGGSGG